MPAGRPTKYKKEFCQIAIDEMAKGFSKEAVAGILGIAKDTLYNWIKKHKEFSDAIKKGEALSLLQWEKIGMAGTLGKTQNFSAASWIFNMKNRHGWKDKQEHEHTGGSSPIAMAYDPKQLAERQRALAEQKKELKDNE